PWLHPRPHTRLGAATAGGGLRGSGRGVSPLVRCGLWVGGTRRRGAPVGALRQCHTPGLSKERVRQGGGLAVSVTDDVPAAEAAGARVPEQAWSRERASSGDFDRTPPQDLAAEQCVLGGMMLSKDAIADVIEILRSGDFYRPAHATIFDTILDLYGRGEP